MASMRRLIMRTGLLLVALGGSMAVTVSHSAKAADCLKSVVDQLLPDTTQEIGYGKVVFQIPTLSDAKGFSLKPRNLHDVSNRGASDSPVLRDLNSRWDPRKFQEHRKPLEVGVAKDVAVFTKPGALRILDMPIKMVGSVDDYRIPAELEPFRDVIQQVIDHEHSILPPEVLKKYHAYITIDQGYVQAGNMQRKPGIHVDGFQGSRIMDKNEINHSYIVSNLTPTAFYGGPFDFSHIDDRVHDFFLEMDRQGSRMRPSLTKEHHIYLMDAYNAHAATPATKSGHRTFIRISYDVKEFDRLGNTRNPLFDYRWDMLPREVHSTLVRYTPPSAQDYALLNSIGSRDKRIAIEATKRLPKRLLELRDQEDLDPFYNFCHTLLTHGSPKASVNALESLVAPALSDSRALRVLLTATENPSRDVSTRAEEILYEGLNAMKARGNIGVMLDILAETLPNPRYSLSRSKFAQLANGIQDARAQAIVLKYSAASDGLVPPDLKNHQ